jgi:undecaprenyl-phosphate 4-deoxy-4-formamido-L-arabinose transferase
MESISIVIPYFKSKMIEDLLSRIDQCLSEKFIYEILIVDDSESDIHWKILEELSSKFENVQFLQLSKNFGQHNALLAGISKAQNEFIVTLDDDLQNPPEEIPRLLAELINSNLDLVYGVPNRIEQKISRRISAYLIRFILVKLLGVKSARYVSSYRIFRNILVQDFPKYPRGDISLDALLFWGTSRIGALKVRHDARQSGLSNYSIPKLLKFSLDTITGYSNLPLKFATYLGLLMSLFGILILGFVFIRYYFYGGLVVGFTFTTSLISIFAGTQLFTLGIIGEYIARMHLKLMEKPAFVIRKILITKAREF